jgi:hypothetical protein
MNIQFHHYSESTFVSRCSASCTCITNYSDDLQTDMRSDDQKIAFTSTALLQNHPILSCPEFNALASCSDVKRKSAVTAFAIMNAVMATLSRKHFSALLILFFLIVRLLIVFILLLHLFYFLLLCLIVFLSFPIPLHLLIHLLYVLILFYILLSPFFFQYFFFIIILF